MPSTLLTNVPMGALNTMDLSQHCVLMDEWNEDAGFEWSPATVSLMGAHTIVVQEDGKGGLHVAVYNHMFEGDLISLRTYTNKDPKGTEYLHR